MRHENFVCRHENDYIFEMGWFQNPNLSWIISNSTFFLIFLWFSSTQRMVSWWFGLVVWIPVGSPKMKGIGILKGTPNRIPNHDHQLTIGWSTSSAGFRMNALTDRLQQNYSLNRLGGNAGGLWYHAKTAGELHGYHLSFQGMSKPWSTCFVAQGANADICGIPAAFTLLWI